jgi:anaerobic selenocysteine-containing dehydrogenase
VEDVGWILLLERAGWRRPSPETASAFYDEVIRAGGWFDPIYHHRQWNRIFRSPPRRFAFHSAVIAERMNVRSSDNDIKCLPHYEPIHEAPLDPAFPLQLYVYPLALLAGLTDTNVPWLIDASGSVMGQRWTSWVEINPKTAERLHIEDGDPVLVTSSRGQLRTKAKLFEGIMPGVVAMPWGLGHEGGGRWSAGVGQNPAPLVEVQTDPLTSGPYWNATRVSVGKA